MENWKPVVGYEGLYEVSNHGNVRSKRRCGARGGPLTPTLRNDGYMVVGLTMSNRTRQFTVHRLMMLAFVGEDPLRIEVNHIDGVKTHNVLTNMEWTNRKGNADHAVEVLLMNCGEKSPHAKVTTAEVAEIRRIYASGKISQEALGRQFGLSQTHVSRIVLGLSRRRL